MANPAVARLYGLHLWSPLPSGQVGVKGGPHHGQFGSLLHHLPRTRRTRRHAPSGPRRPPGRRRIRHDRAERGGARDRPAGQRRGAASASSTPVRPTTSSRKAPLCAARPAPLRPKTRALLPERLRALALGLAAAHQLSAEFGWIDQYPPTVNEEGAAARVRAVAEGLLGKDSVPSIAPSMAAEDMSYLLERDSGGLLLARFGQCGEGFGSTPPQPALRIGRGRVAAGGGAFRRVGRRLFRGMRGAPRGRISLSGA